MTSIEFYKTSDKPSQIMTGDIKIGDSLEKAIKVFGKNYRTEELFLEGNDPFITYQDEKNGLTLKIHYQKSKNKEKITHVFFNKNISD